jgi:hypothetical protein
MKSCTANGSAQRFMGRNQSRAGAGHSAGQIGFQKITRRFSSDPSRNASNEARRDACKTCFEGSILDSLGRLPAAPRQTGNHRVEGWRRAAEIALLQVVHSSLAER